jgi:hypothetical protein
MVSSTNKEGRNPAALLFEPDHAVQGARMMRLSLVFAAALALAGCDPADFPDPPPDSIVQAAG